MAFSLLTKKGNRQQVCTELLSVFLFCCGTNQRVLQTRTVELPSDSTFAIAMKHQQQAEKEEQQRIKNLVLNYDLRENEDEDGEANLAPPSPYPNIHKLSSSGTERSPAHHHNRPDAKPGKDRGGQRVRKLQLSDVDWYDTPLNNQGMPIRQLPKSHFGTRRGGRGGSCRLGKRPPCNLV
jgi:regulator of nonsense transcripts 2